MNKRFLLIFILAIFFVSIAGRLLPHPANFTPITALALFAGTYVAVKIRWALFLPLGAIFLSDLVIGFYDWRVMISVYAAFFAAGLIGMFMAKKKNLGTILFGTFSASLLFFLVTNFAVWAFSTMYPLTLQGLMMSFALALPFFRHAVLGDFVYVALFFGIYEFALAYVPSLRYALKPVK